MTHPLTVRARRLRRDMTDPERLIWSRVRHMQLGSKFRRQVPIGPYVVDFTCPAARLVVELDGGQHNGCQHDALRDAFLRQEGYTVLRFWNNDVLANIEGVLMSIQSALAERIDRAPPPGLPHFVGEEKTALRNANDAPPGLPHDAEAAQETPSPLVGRVGVGRL